MPVPVPHHYDISVDRIVPLTQEKLDGLLAELRNHQLCLASIRQAVITADGEDKFVVKMQAAISRLAAATRELGGLDFDCRVVQAAVSTKTISSDQAKSLTHCRSELAVVLDFFQRLGL